MNVKLRQFALRFRITTSNQLPMRRARQFLVQFMRHIRPTRSSAALRAAVGLIQGTQMRQYSRQNRRAGHTFCFLTGRGRGSSRRYSISRVRLKRIVDDAELLGVRKSSW